MNRLKALLMGMLTTQIFANDAQDFQSECCECCECIDLVQNSHHFYLGPEVFWGHLENSVDSPAYRKRAIFNATYYGFRAGYEHIEPESYYLNFEGACAWGRARTKYSFQSEFFNSVVRNTFRSSTIFANAEFQGGYSFQTYGHCCRKLLWTPFIGFGSYHTSASGKAHMDLTWIYPSIGLRILYSLDQLFSLGFNLKGTRAIYVHGASGKGFWGIEVDLPLTWTFCANGQWDIQFIPYFSMLNFYLNSFVSGGRLLFGYRF